MVKRKRVSVESVTNALECHLREEGYSPITLEPYRSVWKRFSGFASGRKRRWFSDHLADEYRSFARIPAYGTACARGRAHMARTAMRLLCDFAESGSCRKYGTPPSARMLSKRHCAIVNEYLIHEKRRNLAPGTLNHRKRDAERFFMFIESCGFKLARLKPECMDRYLRQFALLQRDTLAGIMGRLRIFVRYLE